MNNNSGMTNRANDKKNEREREGGREREGESERKEMKKWRKDSFSFLTPYK